MSEPFSLKVGALGSFHRELASGHTPNSNSVRGLEILIHYHPLGFRGGWELERASDVSLMAPRFDTIHVYRGSNVTVGIGVPSPTSARFMMLLTLPRCRVKSVMKRTWDGVLRHCLFVCVRVCVCFVSTDRCAGQRAAYYRSPPGL